VTYVNKKQARTTFPLVSGMDSMNSEMAKRLNYAKEILANMFT